MLTKEEITTFLREREEAKAKEKSEIVPSLMRLYSSKSSDDLLQIVQQANNNWAQIHCAQFFFEDLTAGFGAYTVSTGTSVTVVVPLKDGTIISAKHLPKDKPNDKVVGFRIKDYSKSKTILEGGKEAYTTRVVSEWVYSSTEGE